MQLRINLWSQQHPSYKRTQSSTAEMSLIPQYLPFCDKKTGQSCSALSNVYSKFTGETSEDRTLLISQVAPGCSCKQDGKNRVESNGGMFHWRNARASRKSASRCHWLILQGDKAGYYVQPEIMKHLYTLHTETKGIAWTYRYEHL